MSSNPACPIKSPTLRLADIRLFTLFLPNRVAQKRQQRWSAGTAIFKPKARPSSIALLWRFAILVGRFPRVFREISVAQKQAMTRRPVEHPTIARLRRETATDDLADVMEWPQPQPLLFYTAQQQQQQPQPLPPMIFPPLPPLPAALHHYFGGGGGGGSLFASIQQQPSSPQQQQQQHSRPPTPAPGAAGCKRLFSEEFAHEFEHMLSLEGEADGGDDEDVPRAKKKKNPRSPDDAEAAAAAAVKRVVPHVRLPTLRESLLSADAQTELPPLQQQPPQPPPAEDLGKALVLYVRPEDVIARRHPQDEEDEDDTAQRSRSMQPRIAATDPAPSSPAPPPLDLLNDDDMLVDL